MCDDDLCKLQLVLIQDCKDSLDFVTRIDDESFACALVADDGAVTAEEADGKNLVNQGWTCSLTHPLPRMYRLSRDWLRLGIRSLRRSPWLCGSCRLLRRLGVLQH